jgi:predicted ABC-type ATPase
VKLIVLSLASADLAVERVASRVAQGGHDVPEEVIRRRFDAGLRNLKDLYQELVDSWTLYDNSGLIPQRISWGDGAPTEWPRSGPSRQSMGARWA